MPHSVGHGDLVPLDQLIRGTPRAHPITSTGEPRNGASGTDEEPGAFLAFVTESRHLPEPPAPAVVFDADVASRSFRGRLPPRLAARSAGKPPTPAFMTIGELVQ
jgi:hypothetical protein